MAFSWASALRIALLLAYFTLPVEDILKDVLLCVENDLGRWGPLVLAIAYIPLTILAVPAPRLSVALQLRLVPFLPFNKSNYLLSMTPVPVGQYMLASWIGMMPTTFALVYVGTTLKDMPDVTSHMGGVNPQLLVGHLSYWVFWYLAGVLIFCITRVAKAALLKALAENEDIDSVHASSSLQLPIMSGPAVLDLHQPLIVKIDARASNQR